MIWSLEKKILKTLENIQFGRLHLTFPNGLSQIFEGPLPGPVADIHIHDYRTLTALALHGDVGFAQSYQNNWWDSSDIAQLLQFGLVNESHLFDYIHGNFLSRLWSRLNYFFNRNSLKGSKRNIEAHYDLGNDFYELWLDPTMTYSSGLFGKDTSDLLQAQYNKYDRILNRFDQSSGKILEIGCGWGGFADRASQLGDFDLTGITLSNEQHKYAQNRLKDKAKIEIKDYRHIDEKFDFIASIEMFEAVGEEYWPTYFGQLKQSLSRKGKAVIQTITIANDQFPRYRKSADMIRSFIFPGGMLPSPEIFSQKASDADLICTNQFSFGLDYARTLEIWLQNFDAKKKDILNLGYDEGFIRLWRFYLALCISGFRSGRTDVMQMELNHA